MALTPMVLSQEEEDKGRGAPGFEDEKDELVEQ